MADKTKIEWTDATWNVITGCSVVSPGCTNCYAMKLAGTRLKHHESRKGLTMRTKAGPVWTGEVRFNGQWLTQPLTWKRPRRIFVCAHGDLFADGVKDEWLDRIFAIMALCPQHTFQVLTKRPERMREYLTNDRRDAWAEANARGSLPLTYHEVEAWLSSKATTEHKWLYDAQRVSWPLPNVWLGVSVEDQRRADERIPVLLDTPATLRWISAEPLLGPIDLMSILGGTQWMGGQRGCDGTHRHDGRAGQVIHGTLHQSDPRQPHHHHDERCRTGLGWIVAGGESGPNARPMHPDWARDLRDQCAAAEVPFNFKQWGEWLPLGQSGFTGWTAANRSAAKQAKKWLGFAQFNDGAGGPVSGVIGPLETRLTAGKVNNRSAHSVRIGKAAAGRLLDGVLHDSFPEVQS